MQPITLLVPAALHGTLADEVRARRARLHDTLQRAASRPVTVVTVPAALFPQLMDGFLHGAHEAVAWAPSLVARDLLRLGLATPLAVADASDDYAAALVGRADIESLVDIAHRRVGWVSRLSTTGYRIPRLYLESFGLDLSTFFASERFYGSHRALAPALASGEIDVAATHSGRLPELLGASRGRILASIGPVPHDMLVARAGMPAALQETLRAAVLDSTLGPHRFRRARAGHLDLFDWLGHDASPAAHPTLRCEPAPMLC
jgi:ABC-type phosphate/phosphonate transport system substrate-binding protein